KQLVILHDRKISMVTGYDWNFIRRSGCTCWNCPGPVDKGYKSMARKSQKYLYRADLIYHWYVLIWYCNRRMDDACFSCSILSWWNSRACFTSYDYKPG